jgi:hypothetical protein
MYDDMCGGVGGVIGKKTKVLGENLPNPILCKPTRTWYDSGSIPWRCGGKASPSVEEWTQVAHYSLKQTGSYTSMHHMRSW